MDAYNYYHVLPPRTENGAVPEIVDGTVDCGLWTVVTVDMIIFMLWLSRHLVVGRWALGRPSGMAPWSFEL